MSRGAGPGVPPRPAWYAAGTGPWRQWWSLLHPPYTAWHLSYVLIGAALAPRLHIGRLLATLAAFALAVGVGAHALDELKGRPLATTVPGPVLATAALVSLGGALALGAAGIATLGWPLAGFMVVGCVLVTGYNLELGGGLLHNDAAFALAWGSFPVLTAFYAQDGSVRASAAVAAAGAYFLSRAQRALSSPARRLRRTVTAVSGELRQHDGRSEALTREKLLRPLETALVSMSWATCLLGIGLVVARTGH